MTTPVTGFLVSVRVAVVWVLGAIVVVISGFLPWVLPCLLPTRRVGSRRIDNPAESFLASFGRLW